VLDALPAVTRVPLADADTCCGSAGARDLGDFKGRTRSGTTKPKGC